MELKAEVWVAPPPEGARSGRLSRRTVGKPLVVFPRAQQEGLERLQEAVVRSPAFGQLARLGVRPRPRAEQVQQPAPPAAVGVSELPGRVRLDVVQSQHTGLDLAQP